MHIAAKYGIRFNLQPMYLEPVQHYNPVHALKYQQMTVAMDTPRPYGGAPQ